MEMQMEHTLARLLTDVGDNTIALNAQFCSHLGNHFKNVSHNTAVLPVHFSHGADMCLGDHKKVDRSLRRDIIERIAQVILIDLTAGDLPCCDLTE